MMNRFSDLLLLVAAALFATGLAALVHGLAVEPAGLTDQSAPPRPHAAGEPGWSQQDCVCPKAAVLAHVRLGGGTSTSGRRQVLVPRPVQHASVIYRSRDSGEGRAFLANTAKSARRPGGTPVGAHKCLPLTCGHTSTAATTR
ncbi:MAG: hypothetical protein U0031_03485 [Thermomicrobiales bacterium]